jgi:ABC-type Fe3+/spermidine/putrescine transport system ATPase subunit
LELGSFALKSVSFEVADGECLALVGPNGSGKTTLIECIAGIRQIESGKIEFNGIDVTYLAPEKRQVGYVPQDCLLFPHLTVDQNIAFGQRKAGVEAAKQVKEMMEWLSVSHLFGRHTMSLSGGEKQKVALARALITRPKVLLLDEPVSAVDRASRTRLLGELRRSLDEVSRTLRLASIYVTHDLAEAQQMSGYVAIMNNGAIEQVGLWDRVIQTPRSMFVADFMGFNILRGRVTSTENDLAVVEVAGQGIAGPAGDLTVGEDVLAVLRPQAISLSLESDIRKPSWRHCQCNVFKGSVTGMRKMGSLAQVSIDVGFQLSLEMSSELLDELNFTIGGTAFAQFKASEVSFLRA